MLKDYLVYLVILFLVAALFSDEFVFTVLYLLATAYFFGRMWSRRSLSSVSYTRSFAQRVFCGEDVPVFLQVTNRSVLPVVWLRLVESVPVELAPPVPMRQVISLGPRGQANFDYTMRARKRGYYQVGPLFATTGDLLGLAGEQRTEGTCNYLTVYPRILQFSRLELPSHSPIGTLRYNQPIYEDPNRVFGKRDYTNGDSLRRVDWKTTASIGRMQVRQFEPSISLNTVICLNLTEGEYDRYTRVDALELAIVIAASMANWVVMNKQSVGLITTGTDPLGNQQRFKALPARKGRGNLMHILDVLARVQPAQQGEFVELLRQEKVHFPWGTTMILITAQVEDRLFYELLRARQVGLNLVLVLVGKVSNIREIKARGQHFGIPVYHFRNEMDLDMWRE